MLERKVRAQCMQWRRAKEKKQRKGGVETEVEEGKKMRGEKMEMNEER